jgi:hypothetical protein
MAVVHLRQDLSLKLLFSGEDLDRFQESFPYNRRKVDPHQPRRLWACLEIISENSEQVSFIQQITHINRSQVGFDNMRMYVTIDP